MSEKLSDKELLYDPLFAKKPVNDWEDSEKGGFFGKAIVKKALFVLVLGIAIGASLYFSFNALGKAKYSYKETDNGFIFTEFNGKEKDRILDVEYVQDENGQSDTSKPITAVRNFTVCCNEYIEIVYIGKDVKTLENNCFYYCTNLKAILVDPKNDSFVSVDGVLYNKDMTEILMHPIKNHEYRASLTLGLTAPTNQKECETFLNNFDEIFVDDENKRSDNVKNAINTVGINYAIPDSVTRINDFCFSYCEKLVHVKIPDGIKEFGQMAFFKCSSLESIYFPDGLEKIGSDAISYCAKINYIYVPSSVKEIGHHAFFGCLGCDTIYLGANKHSEVKTGESWLPKKNEKSAKNADTLYGQVRRAS